MSERQNLSFDKHEKVSQFKNLTRKQRRDAIIEMCVDTDSMLTHPNDINALIIEGREDPNFDALLHHFVLMPKITDKDGKTLANILDVNDLIRPNFFGDPTYRALLTLFYRFRPEEFKENKIRFRVRTLINGYPLSSEMLDILKVKRASKAIKDFCANEITMQNLNEEIQALQPEKIKQISGNSLHERLMSYLEVVLS